MHNLPICNWHTAQFPSCTHHCVRITLEQQTGPFSGNNFARDRLLHIEIFFPHCMQNETGGVRNLLNGESSFSVKPNRLSSLSFTQWNDEQWASAESVYSETILHWQVLDDAGWSQTLERFKDQCRSQGTAINYSGDLWNMLYSSSQMKDTFHWNFTSEWLYSFVFAQLAFIWLKPTQIHFFQGVNPLPNIMDIVIFWLQKIEMKRVCWLRVRHKMYTKRVIVNNFDTLPYGF